MGRRGVVLLGLAVPGAAAAPRGRGCHAAAVPDRAAVLRQRGRAADDSVAVWRGQPGRMIGIGGPTDPPGTDRVMQVADNSDQTLAQRGQEQTKRQPFGPLKGKATLSPRYDNLGKVRPLGPGEYVSLDGGGMANEMSWTVEMGNNQWGVVPGLWVINGVPTHVPAPIAQQYARQSNLNWPTFRSEDEAN